MNKGKSHGHRTAASSTPTYSSWSAMINRCHNPNDPGYPTYGARGITVCDRWRDFRNFLADMGERPQGKTLDRINNEKGYSPENCRWATYKEQVLNRHLTQFLTFQGETLCIKDWARRFGLAPSTVYHRLNKRKWSIEKTLTTPSHRHSFHTHNGETLSISEWARRTGLSTSTINDRLEKWNGDFERAISTPLRKDVIGVDGVSCPYCHTLDVARFGLYRGHKRYRCKQPNCQKTFHVKNQ